MKENSASVGIEDGPNCHVGWSRTETGNAKPGDGITIRLERYQGALNGWSRKSLGRGEENVQEALEFWSSS